MKKLDSMCITIEKVEETQSHVDYAFSSAVYEPDPLRVGRMAITGENKGKLRIVRATGEVVLLEAMPDDSGNKRFGKAASAMRKHWAASEYPEKTLYACG